MSALVLAATFRFFGSAGAEAQLTPSDLAMVPLQTNVADVSAFGELTSERWKLHVKLRADASDRGADRARAGEAYVQFHATEWLDLTAGRVIDKWGTGYAWTPTAFVGPAKDPADPGDRRSAYRGADMLRADVFVKGTNVSLYALDGGAFAARVYRLVRGTDVSLVYRRDDGQTDVGMNLSRVFGDALEVHGEVARSGDTVRALAGAQYTFANDVNAVVEIYYDRDAYTFLRLHRSFDELSVELLAIASLRDASTVVRATLTYKLRPSVSAYLIQTEFVGNGALARLPVERVTTAGLRLYF
ncbi:MAG TPA: hypothetical protein VHL59_10040 [Thermoanaerobaculia bacterium]|nr:hypothetical protein [Thermoanaerobaculia bacterium]